jgi:two-component system sensor histidine kinase UhpB
LRFVDTALLILSASLGLFLAIFIARNRRAPGSQALSVLILGASIWSLGYAFEILAYSLTAKLFWERFEFFGIVVIPLAWFTFVAQYLGYPKWMKRILQHRFLLGIIPVVTLILVWTNDLHHLVWNKVEMEPVGPLIMLDITRGPWFWVLMIFSYTLLLLGSVKLVASLFNIVRLQRWQVLLTLLAIILPWIGNILYITGLSPEHILDWTAFLFLISGVLFSISLFRFQLVDIVPIAQETVFDGLSDCVIVLDLNDNIVESNPSAKKMISCLGDESLGRNLSQVMPDLAGYIKKSGFAKEYIAEYTEGEGEGLQYYDLHISLLSDAYNNPIGRVVVLHQITKLKQDQAELERARDQLELVVSERTDELRRAIEQLQDELIQRTLAEKRFEDVIEAAPDAMFVLDQSGKILLINAMAERLFGYPREELLGMNIASNLIPVRYRERQHNYFQQLLDDPSINQSSFGVDLYAMRKDGSEFPMEVDLSRLDATSGFWVAINVRDISERMRVETALRESEQTYRALFENAGDAIFLTNLDGRILQVNQKSAELLGFTRAELQALSIQDITMPEELVDVQQNMERLKNGYHLPPYVRHYLKKSGEVLPTENNTVLVNDADGKPIFYQNISRDISERIKAEQAQHQLLEEIRKSNEQMRDLAFRLQEVQELERRELATVLHDRVGQNLTGLNLNMKILQNQLQPEDKSEIQKRLSDSLMIVEETTHQIRDVMADLNPPVLDEYGLMAAIKWYSGDFSNRTGIATQVSGDKSVLQLEPSVEKILFRMVQESLNNVAKHAQASRADIGVKITSEMVSLTVKDNGKGFDTHQIDGITSEPHWGLLSMQQRAASIGADLVIDSSVGAGTEVCVTVRRNHRVD